MSDSKNSRNVSHAQTLARIPPTQAKRFLAELANLGTSPEAEGRFREHYGDIIPKWPVKPDAVELVPQGHEPPQSAGTARLFTPQGPLELPMMKLSDADLERRRLYVLRDTVRAIWRDPDARTREYATFLLIQKVLSDVDPRCAGIFTFSQLPPISPFERALRYLLKEAGRLRYCPNPECPAPYFFANRRSQKFCSEACAKPSQREYKRRWWAEHGEARRKARKASAKKSQRKGKGQ